jgi:hypothetical protein
MYIFWDIFTTALELFHCIGMAERERERERERKKATAQKA